MANEIRIAVIGGGLNGIGSGLAILQSFSDVTVTVYSQFFSPYTTGDGAGGMWGPFITPGTSEEDILKWSKLTWNLFATWRSDRKPGVLVTPVCTVDRGEVKTPFWSHIPFNYRELDQQTLRKIGPEYVSGHSYSAFVAEPRIFLPSLMKAMELQGGKFVTRKINRLEDISEEADIIINCSGIGSRDLVPDPAVYPIRGQVMRVKAPWLNFSINDESEEGFCYVIPNSSSIVLGGTHQENDWRTTIDEEDSERIWENCTSLVPALKKAEVVVEWAGLRPARKGGIRLEEDEIHVNSRKIPVVHNYGHGGSGVTTFWGCSLDVRNLVGRILHRNFSPIMSKI